MSVHSHQRQAPRGHRELRFALLMTLLMMVVEFVAAWLSGSLALMADAGHMLADSSALGLSLFAAYFATKPADLQKTYGYFRTEILAALCNGVFLWLLVIWIFVRAIHRLQHPMAVDTLPMMMVAVVGLSVNLLIGRMLNAQRSENLNVQGAWLNVMSDALGSLGVIVAGMCIYWFGWLIADPIASMVIGTLIALTSWKLVRQAVNVLLEGAPAHLNTAEIVQAMNEVDRVVTVHDVHLWSITTGMDAMSGHVVIEDVASSPTILSRLHEVLSERFGISHTTLQLESRGHECRMSQGTED